MARLPASYAGAGTGSTGFSVARLGNQNGYRTGQRSYQMGPDSTGQFLASIGAAGATGRSNLLSQVNASAAGNAQAGIRAQGDIGANAVRAAGDIGATSINASASVMNAQTTADAAVQREIEARKKSTFDQILQGVSMVGRIGLAGYGMSQLNTPITIQRS